MQRVKSKAKIVKIRHWTPRYLLDRALCKYYFKKHPKVPWLSKPANEFLGDWLKPQDNGMEWGAGHGTIWLAGRVKHLVSVETSPDYYRKVRQQLADENLNNVELHFVQIENHPDTWTTDHPYLKLLSVIPEATLDFALNDGLVRELCMDVAMRKLKPGGLLVLDDSQLYLPHVGIAKSAGFLRSPITPKWTEIAGRLSSWRCIWTSDGVKDTAFWIRPPA